MSPLDEARPAPPPPVPPATRRRRRLELAERLILEYAGAIAPGRVLATVLRTDRLIRGHGALDDEQGLCETLVRQKLAECAARGSGRHRAGPVSLPH